MCKRYFVSVFISCIFVSFPTYAHEIPNHTYYDYGDTSQYNNASNQVTITTDNNYRYITSNGIPYWHGQFPNANNPNYLTPQNYHFKMPVNPKVAAGVTQLWGGMNFGVGLDGVPFDPGTAELWHGDQNWRYEAMSGKINLGLDQNNAHVQPGGAYHYHGIPTELTSGQSGAAHSAIVGYAADGFPIYSLYGYINANDTNSGVKELTSSYQLKTGYRPSGPGGLYDGTFTQDYNYVAGSGDLDECNGRFGITPDYPQGIYAYFITASFPLIPRCFKGAPDQSFVKQGGGGPQSMGSGSQQGMGSGSQQGIGSGMQRRPPPPWMPPPMQ